MPAILTVLDLPPIGAVSAPPRATVAEVNNPGCSSPLTQQSYSPDIHQLAISVGSAGVVNSSGDFQSLNRNHGSHGVTVTVTPGHHTNSSGDAQLLNKHPGQQGVTVTSVKGGIANSTGEAQMLDLSLPVALEGPPLPVNVMADGQNHAKHMMEYAVPMPLAVTIAGGSRRVEYGGKAPSDVIIK